MEVTSPSLSQVIQEAKAVRAHVRDCMTDLEGVLTVLSIAPMLFDHPGQAG